MARNNIVAVTDQLAGSGSVGAIVMWTLAGGIDVGELQQAWEAENLPTTWLPTATSPEVAFSRAVKRQDEKRRLIRPAPDNGFIIVQEQIGKHAFDWNGKPECHVFLDKAGRVCCEPSEHPIGDAVRVDYDYFLDNLVAQDVSAWFTSLMPRVDALSMRSSGGVYFVPAHQIAVWKRVVAAVRASTDHTMYEIPAMPSEEAASALFDALAEECNGAAQAIEDECVAADVKLGARALKSRIVVTDQVKSKIERYEKLLGTQMTELRSRIDRLKAGLTRAVLKAEGGDKNPLADFADLL